MPRKPKPIAEQLQRAISEAERRGITRYRIAKLSGVSQQTIHNIADGTSARPRVDVAERVARAIGYKLTLTRDR